MFKCIMFVVMFVVTVLATDTEDIIRDVLLTKDITNPIIREIVDSIPEVVDTTVYYYSELRVGTVIIIKYDGDYIMDTFIIDLRE